MLPFHCVSNLTSFVIFSVFIFKTSYVYLKKRRLWQLNNSPGPFSSQLGCCQTDLRFSATSSSSPLSRVLVEFWWFGFGFFCFVLLCFVLQKEEWECWNLPWRKRRIIIQSDLVNESVKKKKPKRFKVQYKKWPDFDKATLRITPAPVEHLSL